MIPAPFDYARASSVDEALVLLAEPGARALAGGHSLLPLMKLRFARPELVVDIGRLPLRGVESSVVGALTTYRDLAGAAHLPAAARECAAAVGDVQVRNAGTVGGGIAHGDPASDLAAGVIATGAMLRLRSARGTRECAAEDFFVGPFTTLLAPPELLTEIVFPLEPARAGSAYVSVEHPASGYALAGAAASVTVNGSAIRACRIGLTGACPTPMRATAAEAVCIGREDVPSVRELREVFADLDVVAGPSRGEYIRHLVAVVVSRAVARAHARAERGDNG